MTNQELLQQLISDELNRLQPALDRAKNNLDVQESIYNNAVDAYEILVEKADRLAELLDAAV